MGSNEKEENEDDDGPPPGFFNSVFQNLQTHQKIELKLVENDEDEDDDDGPPPGFQLKKENNNNNKKDEIFIDDDDGPPPGFHLAHVDDVSMCDSHSFFNGIEQDKKNPNSQFDLKSFNVKENEKLGLELICQKIEEKLGDGFVIEEKDESEIGSQALPRVEDEKGGFRSISLKGGEEGKVCDGSFLPPRPLIESPAPPHDPPSVVLPRTVSESVHVIEEEKAGDELEVGSQSVPMKVDEKEKDGSELGSRSFPMIEDEKKDNMCEAGFQSNSQKVGEEEKIDDDGPPLGWGSFLPPRSPIESPATPHQPPSAVYPGIAHVKEEKVRDDLKVGSQSDPMKEDEKERDGFKLESQSFPVKAEKKGTRPVKMKEEEYDDEGPAPGWDSFPPPRPPRNASSPPQLSPLTPPPTHSQPSATSSGKAQMICGSCRTLLSYTKGARFVQCTCCETVNLVLEEHQVGQVKCRGCTVLLMYPYGAPSVQCSACLFVTKIGVQNKRPPLSVQQGQRQPSPNQVH